MVNELPESDFLYVKVSPPRTKILRYLNKQNDFVKLKKIADDLEMGRGKVHFHCKGLEKKGMVTLEKPTYFLAMINEKGREVIKKIDKRV
jgi:DNA-binding MarR family transcriptional regulator